MGAADRITHNVASPPRNPIRVPIRWKDGFSMMNLQAWSDQALHALNSTATVIGVVAAAVVLLCIGLIYFSGNELTARILAKRETPRGTPPPMFTREVPPPNGAAERKKAAAAASRVAQLEVELETARHSDDTNKARAAQLERELSEARLAEKTNAARLSQMQTDLGKVRESDEQKESRVAQLERELTETRDAEKKAAARLAQLESELAGSRRADEEKGVRLAQMDMDLQKARQSTDQAKAETKRVESAGEPRLITQEQRKQFSESVRGLPTGKVLVSAFFENSETHHFGAELLGLLKSAGFSVIERAPLNFFTTSRPSSGVRIGCQDINNPPPHFETVRKALESIGLDAPTTNIVNADEDDVVEIQVTPKQ